MTLWIKYMVDEKEDKSLTLQHSCKKQGLVASIKYGKQVGPRGSLAYLPSQNRECQEL